MSCGILLYELELLIFQEKQQIVLRCPIWALHTFLPVHSMGSALLHVGNCPISLEQVNELRTSRAHQIWSVKCGQFAVVAFLYLSLFLSRQGFSPDWLYWSSFRVCCPVWFQSILQATDWLDRKPAKLGTDVSLLTQVFVCYASRWPRQPLNLPRLGTAWPC